MSWVIFEENAEEYDKWYDRHRDIFLREVECLKRIVDAEKPWLEVGVGTGRFAEMLGIEYGVDPSPKMIEYAKRRGIEAYVAYGEKLPFEENTFGAVFLIVTICFLDRPRDVLMEIRRVLKLNGKLYVCYIPKDSPLGELYTKKAEKGHRFYSRAKFYTSKELEKLLNTCGFEITKVEKAGLEPPDFFCIEAIKIDKK